MEREHTAMAQVDYKLYLAPKSHRGPIYPHLLLLLSNSGRTPSVLSLAMIIVTQQIDPVGQTQKFHRLPYPL